MRVSGDTTIFSNAHEGKDGTWYTYATGVSSKRQDGTYANAYLDVRFRKGVTVENKTKITTRGSIIKRPILDCLLNSSIIFLLSK